MSMNPWNVQSIHDFNFFCCPECVYRSKEEFAFQAHALQNHSLSTTFFHGVENAEENHEHQVGEENEDLDGIKKEEPNQELLEVEPELALENQDIHMHDFDYEALKSEGEDDIDNENDDDDDEDWKPNFKHDSDFNDYDENAKNSDFTDNSCAKCEEKFDDLMDLAVHFNKKHDRVNNRPQCPVCPKSFSQISHLKNHVNVTHLKRFQGQKKRPPKTIGLDSKIQCEYCPALYERKGSLDRHMAKYHPDKIVPDESEVQGETDTTNQECSKCGKSFDDLIVLAEHFNREHDRIDNRYHCPICPKDNCDLNALTMHMKSAHLGLKKKCNECNKVFSLSSYRNHMQSSVCKTSDEVLHCDQCNYSSNVRRNYMKHMKIMHTKREKNFLCDQCDKKFAEPFKLKEHKKCVHEGIKNVKKLIECNLCNEVFKNANKYVQHYQTNHGEIPPEYIDKHIMCDQCPSVFLKKESLQKHIDIAHSGLPGEEPKKPGERRSYIDSIPCSACEETFSAENHYIQHYQTMHGDFPPEFEDREKFMCDQCPAIFLTKQKWTSHKWSVHLKKRKPVQRVQCPQCTKTYKNHSYLKEHILKEHEKVTPFQCTHCHRQYGTKVALKTHFKNMHQKVKCEECNQEICNAFLLKRHMGKVHGLKPSVVFQCEFCPMFYNKQANLTKHVDKNHRSREFNLETH